MMLLIFSLSFIPPIITAFVLKEAVMMPLLESGLIVFITGVIMYSVMPIHKIELCRTDGFLIVILVWVIISLFGVIPFVLMDTPLTFVDALFESVSGITTTGVSVMGDLQRQTYAIQLYHQQLQFLGGLGVVVIVSAVVPLMKIGGMHLYFADLPGPTKEQKIMPQLSQATGMLCKIYLILGGICVVGYLISGMTLFQAFCEMFATISTGGFSLHADSFAHYSKSAQRFALLIMILGATNFQLHYAFMLKRSFRVYLRNFECRSMLLIMLFASLFTFMVLVRNSVFPSANQSFINSFFTVVSLMTTTGFTISDFASWPTILPEFIMILGLIGCCAGSTTGGIKLIRVLVSFKHSIILLKKNLHPAAIVKTMHEGESLRDEAINAIMGYIILFFYVFFVLLLALIYSGLDLQNAFTSLAACIANVGAGINQVNIDDTHKAVKVILTFAMLVGRIEITSFFVILLPTFWRA